ncbi:molybdopterin cofactor-binding domain-containing protein [Hyphococcus formosus]|uniref:xanthine dehydrogenase family protein molybdopterin-binding subunit n=1 Tax=Hyphococcus formosus TaxID=3143534 RepID=UPI00398B5D37
MTNNKGKATINRRQVLFVGAAIGGGLAAGMLAGCGGSGSGENEQVSGGGLTKPQEIGPWVVINPDDSIKIYVPSPEFGTGGMTQQAMIVNEELMADWSKVDVEVASVQRDYINRGEYSPVPHVIAFFGGRSTISMRIKSMQQVGASVRERLRLAAAEHFSVKPEKIDIKDGVLVDRTSGQKLSFGAVAEKAAQITLDVEPAIKDQSDWAFLSKPSPGKVTTPKIVEGALEYGIDVNPPGMVYAALAQSPVSGGRLVRYDADAVKDFPGVLDIVTVDPDEPRGLPILSQPPYGFAYSEPRAGVAVIAEHYWQARKALDALPIEWSDGPGAEWDSTEKMYDALSTALDSDDNARVEVETGDVADDGTDIVEHEYLTPWCDQAPLEPLNGTAMVTDDRVEVWHPGQNAQQSYWVAADEAGMLPERVILHQPYVGGAFGRRLMGDDTRMVVAVAKKFPGRPVKVIWSREEMTRQGKYRPVFAARFRAKLNSESGLPESLTARQASRGHYPRLADCPYFMGLVPNVRVDARDLPFHLEPGPYRGPGYNSYGFVVDTFIDECAVAAGIDPMVYRLKLLRNWPNPGWVKCLEEVKKKSNWGEKLPRGKGKGVAISAWGLNGDKMGGTCVAVVATVEVTPEGQLTVESLDVAFDCGQVMNKDFAENMIEGGTIYGLNMALNEEITVENARVVEGNFHQYHILRMRDVPEINIHYGGLSGADRFGELGEPPVGPAGPAVGNAIFAATGIRVRRQPFMKQDLSWS